MNLRRLSLTEVRKRQKIDDFRYFIDKTEELNLTIDLGSLSESQKNWTSYERVISQSNSRI